MAIFFTITLAVSVVGMISLLILKRYELNTGRIFFSSSRPAIGEFFHRKLLWLEFVLPGLLRVGVRALYRSVRRLAHKAGAWVVVKAEQGLEHALHRVRHSTTVPRKREETSAFLREVAEHKKKLQDENPDRGIVEE